MKKKAANRPLKYGRKTKIVTMRVPEDLIDSFKAMVKRWLSKYKVKNK